MYKKYDIKELNLTFFKVHCFPEEVSGTKTRQTHQKILTNHTKCQQLNEPITSRINHINILPTV